MIKFRIYDFNLENHFIFCFIPLSFSHLIPKTSISTLIIRYSLANFIPTCKHCTHYQVSILSLYRKSLLSFSSRYYCYLPICCHSTPHLRSLKKYHSSSSSFLCFCLGFPGLEVFSVLGDDLYYELNAFFDDLFVSFLFFQA